MDYKDEIKKNLLALILLITITIITIGFLVWAFVFNKDKSTNENVITFGDAIVSVQEGTVQLLSPKNEVIEIWELDVSKAIPNNDASAIYLIDKSEQQNIYRLSLNEENKLKKIYSFTEEIDIESESQWSQDVGAFYNEKTKTFTLVSPEFLTLKKIKIEESGVIENWLITDKALYYSINKILYRYDIKDEKVNATLSIDEKTLGLYLKSDSLFIVSKFGSNNSQSTLMNCNADTLEIGGLSMINNPNVETYATLVQNQDIYYSIVNNEGTKYYYTYDAINKRAGQQLSIFDGENEQMWFGNQFVYVVGDSKAYIQPTYSTTPVFEIDGQLIYLLPIYK